ncbi:dual oxidase maturation factor 1-like isoform X2 [Ornithodoros turicata]|uniref:dual oxidase maturation factor 1-like isoform X2 n=1 Tax=Ornithodoros turicata TaxID=34597 RepID=UPI003139B26B
MSFLYSALRSKPFPTGYPENRTPVTADVLEAGLILGFCILTFCFFIVLPGVRRKGTFFVRTMVSLFIGAFILLCNFGQEWEYSKIQATTPYRAFSDVQLKAHIEVKIGLRSVNITLRNVTHADDKVDYNERFTWAWDQGRLGFGPQGKAGSRRTEHILFFSLAGHYNQDFRAAQVRGAPFPILWIAEYFTFDGEGIRFGRHYRTAGWYTHILLWTAFPLWLLSNIVFLMVLWYGAYLLLMTAACLLAGSTVYATVRNSIPLEIPFYYEDQLVVLKTHYGWCFWMNLINGILCAFVGLAVLFMDLRYPEAVASFFGIDVYQEYEEVYTDQVQEATPVAENPSDYGDMGVLRKRVPYSRFRRNSIRKPSPAPRRIPPEDDAPVYANYEARPRRYEPIGEDEESTTASRENILMKTYAR